MSTPNELEAKFWNALVADKTMMIGLDGVEDGHARPMTAQVDGDHGPVWFFTSQDNGIVTKLGRNNRAIATFTSKGNDLFATVHGSLVVDHDPGVIDRFWNPYVSAWYSGGKTDPKLVMLRFEVEQAEIWADASSVKAGIKMLFGDDPKEQVKDKVAVVNLR